MRLSTLAAWISALTSSAGAFGQQLPVPCAPCAGGPAAFVSAGSASYTTAGTAGVVNQFSDRAILNWQSFDIGAGHSVQFVQPSSTSAALNRIHQSDPSRILGNLSANGQVYLVNQNGIVFGSGARVDARALVASTLNVADDIFTSIGIANAINQGDNPSASRAAFEGASDAKVLIESGARLRADERIIIIGAEVENRGTVEAPDGQAILAASHDRVYLSSDRELRGLLVEVDTGGSVSNLGEVLAERGNATLLGLAVNQSGRVSATTSVNVNGSIRLVARDRATPSQFVSDPATGARTAVATRAGEVIVGTGAVTEITPEHGADATAVDGQEQPRSSIEIQARSVAIERDARLAAPGGSVSITATRTPNQPLSGGDRQAGIRLAPGAVIDVSGDTTALVPMERNQGSLKLFGNELADAPFQRGGALARQEITVDLRKGTAITRVDKLLDDIRRTVGERLSAGGEIELRAEGDVLVSAGSTLDFSGGFVTYLDGYLSTTKLVKDGAIVDISQADPRIAYDGIFGRTELAHRKWGITEIYQQTGLTDFVPGYVEGKDAGSLTVQGAGIDLSGELLGATIRGPWQRDPAAGQAVGVARPFAQVPLAGLLDLSRSGSATNAGVVFADAGLGNAFDAGAVLPAEQPLVIPVGMLGQGGINRLAVSAAGLVTIPAGTDIGLDPGGSLTVAANAIEVESDIRIAAGTVRLLATSSGPRRGRIELAAGVEIDVGGRWINDLATANGGVTGTDVLALDGGRVTLDSQGDLILAAGSRIDVDGGAHLGADGDIEAGDAGAITLASRIPNLNEPTQFVLDALLSGQAPGSGGALRIDAAAFLMGAPADDPDPGILSIPAERIVAAGFRNLTFNADRGGFTIAEGTTLNLTPLNLELTSGFQSQPSGADIAGFSRLVQLPQVERATSSLTARVARAPGVADADGRVVVGAGAAVRTEAGGEISFSADSDIVVDGALYAPGGRISLALGSPGAANETGFRASQGIRLGPAARLDAGAVALVEPVTDGRRNGEVLQGGSVSLHADRGYVIAAPGSIIDVSGTSTILDLPGDVLGMPVATVVASAAGTLEVQAAEGIVLGGDLLARPGAADVAGGTLRMTLDTANRDPNGVVNDPLNPAYTQFPFTVREIRIGAETPDFVEAGEAVPAQRNGIGFLSEHAASDAGFDVIELVVPPLSRFGAAINAGRVTFDGDVVLQAGRRLTLDAGEIASTGGAAQVRAPLIELGPTGRVLRIVATPGAGTGTIRFDARHIDLIGNLTFSGFAAGGATPAVTLASSGDIRARGVRFGGEAARALPGSLTLGADLMLQAARIHPTTLTDYAVEVTGANGRIVVAGAGDASQAPLSAAGRLSLSAADIVQGGTLRAPMGAIELDASNTLQLQAGSVTSVSAAGAVVPFGINEFGTAWIYPLGDVTLVLDGAPAKSIVLSGPTVAVDAGALVDLSGGGDLLTYEFVAGPGGTRDILAGNNADGAFAVLPGLSGLYGAYDPLESAATGIAAGSTVVIADGSVIPAGEYARLPARYALLPGAYLLTPVPGTGDLHPSMSRMLADGTTPLVAGRIADAGTAVQDARWSGFSVENGAQVRARAQYNEYLASDFFAASAAPVPADAGRLTIAAERAIAIDGTLAAGGTGRGAEVDIVADRIAVVAQRTPGATAVELVDAELGNFSAASLLLGGSREPGADGVAIDVRAQSVTVESGAHLAAPEIVLAATDEIGIRAGSVVAATGAADALVDSPFMLSGDGAFLRVAAGAHRPLQRDAAPGVAGRLDIAEGARVEAAGSIALEASRDVLSAGDLSTPGGAISLTASLISLGAASGVTQGLVLTNDDLGRLQAAELRLDSRSTVDIYGSLDARLANLVIDAAGMRGFDNAGAVASIAAADMILGNSRGAMVAAAGSGSGALALSAGSLILQGGGLDVSGFGAATVGVTGTIVSAADAAVHMRGDLTIAAARITADAGTATTIEADGNLHVAASSTVPSEAPAALGASYTFRASAVDFGGRVELPSGTVLLDAAGPDGIDLLDGALLDVSGLGLRFGDLDVGTDGGSVRLQAAAGGIDIGGATIAVASGGAGARAGSIGLSAAQGSVAIASGARLTAVDGGAVANAGADRTLGGALSIDAGQLPQGASAVVTIAGAGFTRELSLRQRQGDIVLTAVDAITAGRVELLADAGGIGFNGRIDASGADGGSVVLAAGGVVVLGEGSMIDARATAAGGRGGRVFLASASMADGASVEGGVLMAGGAVPAVIDVSGSQGGQIDVRLPQASVMTLADAQPDALRLDGTIRGAARIGVEGFRAYTDADGILVLSDIAAGTDGLLAAGTLVNVVIPTALPSATSDAYAGLKINFTSGNLSGQTHTISGYSGTTRLLTLTGLAAAPDFASGFTLSDSSTTISGSTSTIVRTNLTKTITNFYAGATITFTSGNLNGQTGTVTAYNGATRRLTVTGLSAAPAANSQFRLDGVAAGTVTPTSDVAINADLGTSSASLYVGSSMSFLSGNLAGTSGVITAYDPVRRIATLAGFSDLPDPSSNFEIVNTRYVDGASFVAAGADIRAGLGAVATVAGFELLPGVEIRTAGNLGLSQSWDLQGWRFDGVAGVLTLRAAGDIAIDANLSDGVAFASVAPGLLPERDIVGNGPSWSYRIVSGADLGAADPLAYVRGQGTLAIGTGVSVRTGRGYIDLAAGADVELSSPTSAVYTVGENRGSGALDPMDVEVLLRGDFVDGGGDVRISAGGSVRGVSDRPLPDWMPRVAGEFLFYKPDFEFPSAWAIDIGRFRQGVGALGGGDVSIRAGGDLDSLTVALPANGLPFALDGTDTRIAGGGDLDVEVAGDVIGGMYLLGRGTGTLRSGGRITGAGSNAPLPIVALGDGQLHLQGRTGVAIETVLNPTLAEPDPTQGLIDFFFFPQPAYFFTYSPRSAVTLASLSGDVIIHARGQRIANLYGDRTVDPDLLTVYPSTLDARAFDGDVLVEDQVDLFPSPQGNLTLLAGRDVTTSAAGTLRLTDADPGLLPRPEAPSGVVNGVALRNLLAAHAPVPMHAGDPLPARIVARAGSVGTAGAESLTFNVAKQVRMFAGTDIANHTLVVQHANAGDLTVLQAGRDIAFATFRRPDGGLAENTNFIDLAGPGRIELMAAREIDFGTAVGIQTRGDSSNPALADTGADISLWAGIGSEPDVIGFFDRYFDSEPEYATLLEAYVEPIMPGSAAAGHDAFIALDPLQRRQFVLDLLYDQIRRAGLESATTGSFERGFTAIDALFPGAQYDGDIRSFLSRITTLDGGDINLVVPGGIVNAGVASSGSLAKSAEKLGVVAQREGTINAVVRGDFLVNASRVFALDGGDILIWSSQGDIDAGRGAKSALAIPPPTTTFDAQGNAVVEFPPAISGSGIRTAVSSVGKAPGSVFLFAPAGVVNAGDAGIESAGNITIAATQVLGAENISVGGVASGVPSVSTSSLAAGLTGVGDVGGSATKSATEAATAGMSSDAQPVAKAPTLGTISVEVLGFGEG
ncbi:MAG: filamentous hemagglutinin family protein [Gammaproteobacteria bacterium]